MSSTPTTALSEDGLPEKRAAPPAESPSMESPPEKRAALPPSMESPPEKRAVPPPSMESPPEKRPREAYSEAYSEASSEASKPTLAAPGVSFLAKLVLQDDMWWPARSIDVSEPAVAPLLPYVEDTRRGPDDILVGYYGRGTICFVPRSETMEMSGLSPAKLMEILSKTPTEDRHDFECALKMSKRDMPILPRYVRVVQAKDHCMWPAQLIDHENEDPRIPSHILELRKGGAAGGKILVGYLGSINCEWVTAGQICRFKKLSDSKNPVVPKSLKVQFHEAYEQVERCHDFFTLFMLANVFDGGEKAPKERSLSGSKKRHGDEKFRLAQVVHFYKMTA